MSAPGGARLDGRGRLRGLDLARGLALLGMLAAHLFALPEWSWSDPATWGAVASGRASILFATVAGVSLALVTGGPRPFAGDRMRVARGRIAVRAALIWALGLALVATTVPAYVILPAYGILFLLSLPLLGLRPRTLGILAAVIAVVMPVVLVAIDALPIWEGVAGEALIVLTGWWYPFVVWAAFLVAGIAIGRLELGSTRVLLGLLGSGAVLALLGYGLAAWAPRPDAWWAQALTAAPHSGGLYEVVGSGGLAVAVIAACELACRSAVVSAITIPLRAAGSMPLTLYTAQLLAWALWALLALGEVPDLSGFRALQPFWPLTIGLVAAATVWALTLGRGPLERLVAAVARRAVPAD